MKIKQKMQHMVFGAMLAIAGFSIVTVSPAAALTPWQELIKQQCSGGADAAERCAQDLRDKLKQKCGPEKNTDKYKSCKRDFINNRLNKDPASDPAGDPADTGTDPCKVKTSIIPVDCSTGGNPIWGLLLMAINILTAGIGIVAIGGLVYAAILWTTAEDKNAQIVKSKETIFNVVIGLVAFALLYAFLQFLIPGGVFN